MPSTTTTTTTKRGGKRGNGNRNKAQTVTTTVLKRTKPQNAGKQAFQASRKALVTRVREGGASALEKRFQLSMMLPTPKTMMRFPRGFTGKPTGLGCPRGEVTIKWSDATSIEDLRVFVLRDPACNFIFEYPNAANEGYGYNVLVQGITSETNNNLTSPASSALYNIVDGNIGEPLITGSAVASNIFEFKPHLNQLIAWEGDTSGLNFYPHSAGETIEFSVQSLTDTNTLIEIVFWRDDSKHSYVVHEAGTGIPVAPNASTTISWEIPQDGYYAYELKATVPGIYRVYDVQFYGSGHVYGHHCAPGYCDIMAVLQDVAVNACSIRYAQTASFTNNEGSYMARQSDPDEFWMNYLEKDEVAQMNYVERQNIKKGEYSYLKVERLKDITMHKFSYSDGVLGAAGTVRAARHKLGKGAGFLCMYYTIQTPEDRSGFFETYTTLEYFTKNQMFECRPPPGKELELTNAIQGMAQAAQHMENESHKTKIGNFFRGVAHYTGKFGKAAGKGIRIAAPLFGENGSKMVLASRGMDPIWKALESA